jgi:hypothetical protein
MNVIYFDRNICTEDFVLSHRKRCAHPGDDGAEVANDMFTDRFIVMWYVVNGVIVNLCIYS